MVLNFLKNTFFMYTFKQSLKKTYISLVTKFRFDKFHGFFFFFFENKWQNFIQRSNKFIQKQGSIKDQPC